MYPQLMNQASRLAPMLSRILQRGGSFATPFWKATQIDTPEVNPQAMPKAPAVSPPISGPQDISYPSVPVSTDNSAPAAPSAPTPPPWWADGQMFNGPGFPASQASTPTQPASVPMPQARPAEAPAPQEDTGFFMRNALMQRDPMTGELIDPMGAKSVRGPDLIAKMMQYLHNKA